MASKFGLAGGIPERRVRPIWDAIDSRQFKNALKLVTSLLAKNPKSPYALALKALILERMGKAEEALSVCLNAKELLYHNDSVLMDDLTLSTLQIVFQRLDHLDLATSCYEYACGKFPNNLELMMGLFNCYVREYSFVKQQQTAIKMYKHAAEERSLLWAVCSIQLQVLCGNGGEKLLLLAEGLLKKHVASHSLHEPEALMVYISILEQQAKYGDALEFLSGKLGSLLVIEVDKLRMQGRLLARAGDYSAAANIFQKILELSSDDWECFVDYLGCLLEDDRYWSDRAMNDHINRSKPVDYKISHLTDDVFDSRISNASAFVQKLQKDTDENFIRCPYLANIEIERRKQLHGKDNDEKLMELLMQYFVRFGHLTCSTTDVEMFLDVLSPKKKIEFVGKLNKAYECVSTVPTKVLGQSITFLKVQELMGNMFELPITELEDRAVKMAELYCKNLPLSKDLDPQESMHGEELLSMLCNVLVQLFWRTRHLGYLTEAIMVLEFGLNIRRHVSQYKILLLHLYSHWGALSLAHQWFKSLDVKNILTETISHHILPQMLVSPLWVDLNNLLQDYLKFMDDHFRESADLTFLAYRHRNYSKVIEFVQFKERLQHSYQYLVARVEAPILQLKQNADKIEEEEAVLGSLKCGIHFLELSNEIGSKSLTFNEDMQSRPWWTPSSERNYLLGPFEGVSYCPREDLTREREASVRRAVERKSLLPRMIYLSIQSASASVKENFEANGSISDPNISSELKVLLERYAKMLGFSFSEAIEVVSSVSGGLKSSEVFGSDLIDWLNFAVFLNSWNLSSHELGRADGDGRQPQTWQIINSLLEKYIMEQMNLIEPSISSPWNSFPILVQLVTEPFAWHGLVIQACVRASLPSGKKKKKTGPSDLSALSQTRDSVLSLCSTLENLVKWFKEIINRPEDEKLDSFLSSFQKEEERHGQVFQILETLASSVDDIDLGEQISQALKSWSHVDVVRKIVTGKCRVIAEFLQICESKLKMLQALKQQIAQF
ncbi:N-terminal acetyltransferase B complex auxiliary subunit NAA25 [Morus notabilis]|uniref:N-terminal acetyltransferase B complex auxiliary subunit NAA25 n=1 Tax=Morus notabilis TaxID=981085 RepID=UPI000CED70C6|nr:N-terminal acetyltransferase B complex auxiliary subunit NAA25 [Morus notabilis]